MQDKVDLHQRPDLTPAGANLGAKGHTSVGFPNDPGLLDVDTL